jgi:hypothetical protein
MRPRSFKLPGGWRPLFGPLGPSGGPSERAQRVLERRTAGRPRGLLILVSDLTQQFAPHDGDLRRASIPSLTRSPSIESTRTVVMPSITMA